MMNAGLVNDQIKKQILEGLLPIASHDDVSYVNGDIKDKSHLNAIFLLN